MISSFLDPHLRTSPGQESLTLITGNGRVRIASPICTNFVASLDRSRKARNCGSCHCQYRPEAASWSPLLEVDNEDALACGHRCENDAWPDWDMEAKRELSKWEASK